MVNHTKKNVLDAIDRHLIKYIDIKVLHIGFGSVLIYVR